MPNPTTPMSTAQFGKAIDPAVRKHFVDAYETLRPATEKIFKVSTQEDYNELHQNYTGLGGLQVVSQGQTYPTGAPIQSFGTTYTPVKYGEILQLTDEINRYDKSGIAKATKAASMQGNQVSRSVDTNGARVFNQGFNTAYTSYGDAKSLFSTQHTRADGGTAWSNASATGIPLSEANLETGLLALEQVLDDRGQLISISPEKLLVPPALRKTALIITKSEMRSDTADNDLNVYNVREYNGLYVDEVFAWNFLGAYAGGSDTAWFLLAEDHKLNWLWGIKPEIGKYNENYGWANDTLAWKVRYEASTGWDDPRRLFGSKGDNQALAT